MALSTSGQQSINLATIQQIQTLAAHSQVTALSLGFRTFQVFECHHKGDVQVFRQWFDALSETQHIWLPKRTNTDRADEIQQLLGSENKRVVYDALDGIDPRLLAASAGTLLAGGQFLLLTPPLLDWQNTYDAEYETSNSRFLARLSTHIQRACQRSSNARFWQIDYSTPSPPDQSTTTDDRTIEQDRILKQLVAQVAQNTPSVIVIQADRGRGKSTLLARLLLSGEAPPDATVTAKHRSAIEVLQQHCDARQYPIHYLPLQEALTCEHKLLLVDEAANIPLPQLFKLTSLSKQIIFATTVEGYEGAGRGFATRFAKHLDENYPDWQLYTLDQPMRWAAHDKLEALMNRALLLKSELPKTPPSPISLDQVHCEKLNAEQLLANDDLLEQAFAILTSAHYQTTAMDLRHMLDSPAMEIWVASMGQIPCAAALVSREGGIEETLYDDITHKRRRLKNQLLVQLLTQFTLSKKILSLQYQRIVRIAVIPQIQNQGVGSALIKAITTDNAESVDVMGTSFGADEASLAFWLKQGFSPVHLGYKRNPRSGLASVAMLLSCNEAAKPALLAAQLLLQLNLNVLRSAVDERSARDHNYVRVVDKLLSQQIQKREDSGIIDIFTPQVELYARGSRNFIDSLAALQWYLQKESLPQKSEAQALFDALLLDTLSPAVDKSSRQKNRQLANLIKKGCSLHEP